MSIFADAGISEGVLKWGEGNSKRRSELAGLFEQFKRNNPEATGADYNSYIESLIGPHEMYMRGNLPGQQMLDRMGADNAEKKRIKDRNANMEYMGQRMAFGNTIKDMAKQLMLTTDNDEEVVQSLLRQLQIDDPAERERMRQQINGMVGNMGKMRKREEATYLSGVSDKIMTALAKSNGEVSVDDLVNGVFDLEDPSKMNFLKKHADNLKTQAQRTRDIQDAEIESTYKKERGRLIDSLANNSRLRAMLTPGSEDFGKADGWLEERLDQITYSGDKKTAAQQRADIKKSVMEEAQFGRSYDMRTSRIKNVSNLTTQINKQMEGQLNEQGKQMVAKAGMMGISPDDTEKAGIIADAALGQLIPSHLRSSFITFIANEEYDTDNPSAAYQTWKQTLAPEQAALIYNPSDMYSVAKHQAEQQFPQQESANSFVQSMRREAQINLDKMSASINQVHEQVVNAKTYPAMQAILRNIAAYAQGMDIRTQGFGDKMDLLLSDEHKRTWLTDYSDVPPDAIAEVKKSLSDGVARGKSELERIVKIALELQKRLPREIPSFESNQVNGNSRNTGGSDRFDEKIIDLPDGSSIAVTGGGGDLGVTSNVTSNGSTTFTLNNQTALEKAMKGDVVGAAEDLATVRQ